MMFTILIIILTIIVSLLAGGKFKNMLNAHFNRPEIIWISVIIYYILRFVWPNNVIIIALSEITLMISIALWAFLNTRYKSSFTILFGTTLNFIVKAFNNWKMPVDRKLIDIANVNLIDKIQSGVNTSYVFIDANTKLRGLSDIVKIKWQFDSNTIFSVGDIVIIIGFGLIIYELMHLKETTN